jgi:hypothetical protein
MFEQLRKGLGDDFYKELHKYYRRHPLSFAPGADENSVRIQQFILRSSLVSGKDLSQFFRAWGLSVTNDTARQIQAKSLPLAPDLTKSL